MPAINPALADASNALVLTAVLLYALAMLCYACDFAFRKERLLAPEQRRPRPPRRRLRPASRCPSWSAASAAAGAAASSVATADPAGSAR